MADNPVSCPGCGQLWGVDDYDLKLWDIYARISDGRSTWEPLVFTAQDFDGCPPGEDEIDATNLAMEKNMRERGLCTECRRPDLRGVTAEQIMSEEDAYAMQEMWAERAAEIRAGC